MKSGEDRLAAWRRGLFLILVGPLLIALGASAGLFDRLPIFEPQPIESLHAGLTRTFEVLLDEAAMAAEATLRAADSGRPPDFVSGPLVERIDGSGVLDENLEFLTWSGTPAEPPRAFADPGWPRWSIRVDGIWTRLLVRAGPDWKGRFALVSAVIDTELSDRQFLDLLPEEIRRGVRLEVYFQDTEFLLDEARGEIGGAAAPPPAPRSMPGATTFWLRSPSGQTLAAAALAPLPQALLLTRVHRAAGAWAALLGVLILFACIDWPTRTRTLSGLSAALATLAVARLVLIWQQVPARLLPRELGRASLYGSSGYADLFASPGDLLLTAFGFFLAAVALRRYLGRLAETRHFVALAVATAAAAGATACGLLVTVFMARNSRIPLLERPTPFEWDDRLPLWIGLILILLGAAELWARVANLLRRSGIGAPPSRLAVILALVPLIATSSFVLQSVAQRIALEQLSSDLAPEVAEQTQRRMVILPDAIHEIDERIQRHDPMDPTQSFKQQDMAYRYWVEGELFHSGYRSSLSFYNVEGHRVSHFGFGLLALLEEIRLTPEARPGEVFRRLEYFEPTAALRQRLIHAQMPIYSGGQLLGIVVGHVLDEPDNLPFLPWTQPYLSALGSGPPGAGREYPDRLHYVLYDASGEVKLTTLPRPPADCAGFRAAARSGERIHAWAGESRYVGIALTDDDDRLHLLLLPALGFLGRVAAMIRLQFLGLAVLLVLRLAALARRLVKLGGVRSLGHELRSSIYRRVLAASLIAAGIPLFGLAIFLRGYIERRADDMLVSEATRVVSVARAVVENYWATQFDNDESGTVLNDSALYWLRNVVGQEIHVYEDGLLLASSKPELFTSGLLAHRLDGEVQEKLIGEGLPYAVLPTPLGPTTIPVAYAKVHSRDDVSADRVVAVPLVLEQRQIAEGTARVAEMILLATVSLFTLLAAAAAFLASSVARPVRELVAAADRISAGDYTTRLEAHTRDEVAELVRGFNAMGAALQRQRADLRNQRDYMETLLHHHTTGVISVDARGTIVTLNPSAAALLEAADDGSAIGSDLRETLALREGLAPLAEALAEPARSGSTVEVDVTHDDSVRRYQIVRVELDEIAGNKIGAMILIDDVTDLMRSNQLAAWAEMARVIAHEIKNPLTPIQLAGEHLRRLLRDRGLLPSPDMEACLDTIIKQVRALHTIAGEFSAYAKLPGLQAESVDPVEFMRSTLEPYRSAPAPRIELVEQYEPTPHASIDERVLGRAVINLVENALQAMPDGGRLTISVRPDDTRRQALLSVRDTGQGLLPEVRRRLFEPYFSTKSSGTGLGLAIMRRAVEAHEGEIEVESEYGCGTAFVIRLPFSPEV